jgi:hypothetical protein
MIGVAFSLLVNGADAADNPKDKATVCQSLTDALHDAVKRAAYENAGGFMDRGAAQQAARATMVNSELIQAQLNAAQLSAAGCPLPTKPLKVGAYYLEASECALAKEPEIKQKCDRSKWTGK